MKDIFNELFERIFKNPITTLVGISLIFGLLMVYKGMISVNELSSFAVAIAGFLALLYKKPNNDGTNDNV